MATIVFFLFSAGRLFDRIHCFFYSLVFRKLIFHRRYKEFEPFFDISPVLAFSTIIFTYAGIPILFALWASEGITLPLAQYLLYTGILFFLPGITTILWMEYHRSRT